MRIRMQQRLTDDGCFLRVVSVAGVLLADCVAGVDCLSVCLADSAAVPDRGDCRAWSFGVSKGAFLPPCADIAWAARDLKTGGTEV